MNKNILIIVNPNAGKGKVQKKIHKIANNFSKQDYVVDIIYTKKNYSAKDIIQDYKQVHYYQTYKPCHSNESKKSTITRIREWTK